MALYCEGLTMVNVNKGQYRESAGNVTTACGP